MVMGGIKLYHVSCSKCDWTKDISVHKRFNNTRGLISKIFGLKDPFCQIPDKCPKCNAKTKHFEDKFIKF